MGKKLAGGGSRGFGRRDARQIWRSGRVPRSIIHECALKAKNDTVDFVIRSVSLPPNMHAAPHERAE